MSEFEAQAMKIYHLNILATKEDVNEVNRVGWNGHPRFAMHADITMSGPRQKMAAQAAFSEGYYKNVAVMEGSDLDAAFRQTNHIERSWLLNEDVKPCVVSARSTSVGDIIETGGVFYMVASMGFEELDQLRSAA